MKISARGDAAIRDSKTHLRPRRELRECLRQEYARAEGDSVTGPPSKISVRICPEDDAACGPVAEVIFDCQAAGFIASSVKFGDKSKERLLRLEPLASLESLSAPKEPKLDQDPQVTRKLVVWVEAVTKGNGKGSIAQMAVRSDATDHVSTKDELAKRVKEEVEDQKRNKKLPG